MCNISLMSYASSNYFCKVQSVFSAVILYVDNKWSTATNDNAHTCNSLILMSTKNATKCKSNRTSYQCNNWMTLVYASSLNWMFFDNNAAVTFFWQGPDRLYLCHPPWTFFIFSCIAFDEVIVVFVTLVTVIGIVNASIFVFVKFDFYAWLLQFYYFYFVCLAMFSNLLQT